MDADLTPELGQLLEFVADVAIAIRMNSAYNRASLYEDRERVALDVMWLADSLHRLDVLGRALHGEDAAAVAAECAVLSRDFEEYKRPHPGEYQSEPMETFERHRKDLKLDEGISIIEAIKAKVSQPQER